MVLTARDETQAALNRANKQLKDLNAAVGETNKSLGSMASFAKSAALAFVGLEVSRRALDAFSQSAIGLNAKLEQAGIAFKVMTGSAEVAAKHLNDLKQLSKESAIFELADVLEFSKRLQAMSFSADEATQTLKVLGDIGAGVGKEKLPQLVLALGQVKAATRLTGNELRQFTEAGVPLLDELAKAYGKSAQEIRELVEDGKVGFESVRFVLEGLVEEGGRFNNLNEEQRKSFSGAMNEIKESLSQTVAEGFEPLFGSLRDGAVAFAEFLGNKDASAHWASTWNGNLKSVTVSLGGIVDAAVAAQRELTRRFDMAMNSGNRLRESLRTLPGMESGVLGPEFLTSGGINFHGGVGDYPYGPEAPTSGEASAVVAGRTPPPFLGGTAKAGGGGGSAASTIREAAGASRELIEQMLNAKAATDAWRESLRAALMTGEMTAGDVAEEFGKAGMTAEEAFRDIEKMLKENAEIADDYAKQWQRALDIVQKRKQEQAEWDAKQREIEKQVIEERAAEHARMVAEMVDREFRAGQIISQRAESQFRADMSAGGAPVLDAAGVWHGKFADRPKFDDLVAYHDVLGNPVTMGDAKRLAAEGDRLTRRELQRAEELRRGLEEAKTAGSDFESKLREQAKMAAWLSGNPFMEQLTILQGLSGFGSNLAQRGRPTGHSPVEAARLQAEMAAFQGAALNLGTQFGFGPGAIQIMVDGNELGRLAGLGITQSGMLASRFGVL